MPLSTTNLTLHGDASDADNVFSTYNSGGGHSGDPGDGGAIQVWDDEDDGVADIAMMWDSGTSSEPDYRTATPGMLLPCVDFDGSTHFMKSWNQVGDTPKNISSLISSSAWSALIAIYPESITLANGDPWDNHTVISDGGDLWNISLKDDGAGNKKAELYAWDGAARKVVLDLSGVNTSFVIYWKYDGANMYGSLNGGSLSSPVAMTGIVGSLATPFVIGKAFFGGTFYHGRIGEYVIWNAALSGTPESDSISYMTTKWITGAPAGGHPANRRFGLTNSGLWLPRHRPIEVGRLGTMVT